MNRMMNYIFKCRMARKKRNSIMVDNNRGSTLIEVIVCVLIIGIAFVPLMIGLTASLRINRQTENRLYAENVAQNIVEICKTFGVQGMEKLEDLGDDPNNGIRAFLAGDKVLLSQKGDDPAFTIENISSGADGKLYYAEVEFQDNYSGEGQQNDFSDYQSITGFTSAVVVPFEKDDFDTIISFFYDISKDPDHKSDDSITMEALKSSVETWLKRQITITINEVKEEGKTRYAINRKMEYIADGDVKIGDDNIFENGSIKKVIYQTQPYKKKTIEYTTNTVTEDLTDPKDEKTYNGMPESIIITYSELSNPFGEEGQKGPFWLKNNSYDIEIIKNTDGYINVYAICADKATVKSLSHIPTIGVSANGHSGSFPNYQVGVFSNLVTLPELTEEQLNDPDFVLTDVHYQNCKTLTKFGQGTEGKQSVMKDVIIKVREYDDYNKDVDGKTIGKTKGEVVVEKESTVIEFERK